MSMTIGSSLKLASCSFEPGREIPMKYTCDGNDISPGLSWEGAPDGTETFALIVDDPDAPGRTFTHWVIYNISAKRTELPEGVPAEKIVKKGCSQGMNDFKMMGYGGPCPPPGMPHHYRFHLYRAEYHTRRAFGRVQERYSRSYERARAGGIRNNRPLRSSLKKARSIAGH